MVFLLYSFALVWIALGCYGWFIVDCCQRLVTVVCAREDQVSLKVMPVYPAPLHLYLLSRLAWPIVLPALAMYFLTRTRSQRRHALAMVVIEILNVRSRYTRWSLTHLLRLQRAVIRWTVVNDATDGSEI